MPQPKKSGAAQRSGAKSSAAKKREPARKRAAPKKQAVAETESASVPAALREALGRNTLLSGERLRETVDEAVKRGRMTRADAEDLVQSLLQAGRRQTQDLLSELEELARRAPGSDRALQQVDRARRAAGVGGSFPVSGYDDLTAAQVTERLTDLTAAQLRKIRDHERRNANRKSVLGAIERKLD